MTNLAQRDERLQLLVAATTKARAQRDEVLTRMVKAQTKLVDAEKTEARFRKSTKRLKAQARTVAKPVTPAPEPKPPEPAEKPDALAKATAIRAELQGEHQRKRKRS